MYAYVLQSMYFDFIVIDPGIFDSGFMNDMTNLREMYGPVYLAIYISIQQVLAP
jgi:hypothetical protein